MAEPGGEGRSPAPAPPHGRGGRSLAPASRLLLPACAAAEPALGCEEKQAFLVVGNGASCPGDEMYFFSPSMTLQEGGMLHCKRGNLVRP